MTNVGENWDYIIMHEMAFYYNFPQFEQEIHDLLKENKLNIQVPTTRFGDEGIYIHCPGPEDQAINRIEKEQALTKILEHGRKRVNRLLAAMDKLEKGERDLLLNVENETKQELKQSREKAIRKLHKLFIKERLEHQKSWNALAREERRERIKEANIKNKHQIKGVMPMRKE